MIRRILPELNAELDDPRYFQILYLGSFLLFGMSYLGWQSRPLIVLSFILTAMLSQLFFALRYGKSLHSVKSALITSLGLSLLLHVNSWWVAVLAAFLAIGSKFLIRYKGKHVFNPANFGIIASVLISGEAWVSPGQWGSEAILLFFMGSAGLMMILKVGRLDTAFSFLGSFALLKLIYVVIYLGWDWDVWLHQMMNGTLLLFAFFMITDPMTTPNHSRARILWSLLLSLMIFTASIFFYVQTAVVWMLFLLSFFTPLFDRIYQGKKYEWNMRNDIKTQAI